MTPPSTVMRLRLLVATALVCVPMAGCATKVATRSFDVTTTPATNDRSPVAVDFVVVRNEELIPILGQMPARSWFFAQRDQMLLDHPGDLEAHRMDFVPGNRYTDVALPISDRKGLALFVFARYPGEAAHRVRVEHLKHFEIVLGVDGFTVAPAG